jgi:hypothetical protein
MSTERPSASANTESGAEVDFFAPQTDAAAARDHDDLVVEGIIDVRQALVDTRGRLSQNGVRSRNTMAPQEAAGTFGYSNSVGIRLRSGCA